MNFSALTNKKNKLQLCWKTWCNISDRNPKTEFDLSVDKPKFKKKIKKILHLNIP